MRKAAAICGGLIAAYVAVLSAWLYWEDPFLKRDRTLVRMGIIAPPVEMPLDKRNFRS